MAKQKESYDLYVNGEMKTFQVGVDHNEEFVLTSEDGEFFKFPKGEDLGEMVEAHNEANAPKGE